MITEDQILDILDGVADDRILAIHQQELVANPNYRAEFQFHQSLHSAMNALPLESPSMRFTQNVIEGLALQPVVKRAPTRLPIFLTVGMTLLTLLLLISTTSGQRAAPTVVPAAAEPTLQSMQRLLNDGIAALYSPLALECLMVLSAGLLVLIFDKKFLQPYFSKRGLAG